MKKQIVGCIAMALVLTGCMAGKDVASDDGMGTAEVSAVASTDVAGESSSEESLGASKSDSVSSEPYGVYARINKEEHYEGNDVFEREFIYALHEDGTGLVRGNDDFRITWDDKNIYWEVPTEEGIESHEYKLEGNILKVKEVDGWQEYTKKPGDDPIENGDLVEFAGVYSKIENSEAEKENAKTYGDMYFSYGGMIGGGEGYPQVWPDKITKNEDGSYLCEYDNYDFEYTIYPKGVIGEKEASDPELKDKLYIKVAIKKDGETKDIVFYRSAQF